MVFGVRARALAARGCGAASRERDTATASLPGYGAYGRQRRLFAPYPCALSLQKYTISSGRNPPFKSGPNPLFTQKMTITCGAGASALV